jgi:zinc finger SWIM domain-containing protein 3
MDSEDDHTKDGEEYECVDSKKFRSEEEGFRFYNEYAKVKGFSVRKEEVK